MGDEPRQRKGGRDVPATAAAEDTALVSFSTRITAETRRRLRIYAAQNDLDVQDVTEAALVRYLTEHEA